MSNIFRGVKKKKKKNKKEKKRKKKRQFIRKNMQWFLGTPCSQKRFGIDIWPGPKQKSCDNN